MMLPGPPSLGKLRIAAPEDVLRLGIVAAAGFRYSEHFMWERPYHEDYPLDTIIHYRHEAVEYIRSPTHVVLVALDLYDPDESNKTKAVIPKDSGWESPAAGEEVVVGLAIWRLEPGSKRRGKFQNNRGTFPELPESLHRDVDSGRAAKVEPLAEEAEKRYFHDIATMERTVVHPAYWRRGHGGRLTAWGTGLANIDHVNQGVLATTMGAALFKHAGFGHLSSVHIEGDAENPKGLTIEVLRYLARSGNVYDEKEEEEEAMLAQECP